MTGRTESYSSLAVLASCAQKYQFSYVEHLEEPGTDPAMHNGTAMHAATRAMFNGKWDAARLPGALDALRFAWGDFRPPLGHKKAHLTLGFAEERLRNYVAEREARPTTLELGEVVASFSEEMHTFDWSDANGNMVKVRGVPDLVVRTPNGTLLVVDNKFPTSGYLTDHYFLRYSLGFQLRIYAAMYENLTGEAVAGGIINAVACHDKANDGPEKWKTRKSSPSMLRVISFTREQIAEAHEWVRGNLVVRDACASVGVWPKNEMACDDYGGCPFISLCTAPSPMARRARMMTQFKRREDT